MYKRAISIRSFGIEIMNARENDYTRKYLLPQLALRMSKASILFHSKAEMISSRFWDSMHYGNVLNGRDSVRENKSF